MPQMTVQDLLGYLEHLQRFYGGDLPVWLASHGFTQPLCAPLMDARPQERAGAVSVLLLGPGVRAEHDADDAPLPFQLGRTLVRSMDEADGGLVCVGCGCTEHSACSGGCQWATFLPPRCTRCAAPPTDQGVSHAQ